MGNKIDITKTNYELFVIDYLDGKLNANEQECFMAFLDENPSIKEEVDGLEEITLSPGNETFTNKDILKKKEGIISVGQINDENYEEYFIAYYEGDLTDSQGKNLQQFIDKNPVLESEHKIHGKIKVLPDSNIVYADKDELKHRKRIIPFWYSSAAAVILILVSYWFIFNQQPGSERNEYNAINSLVLKSFNNSISTTPNTEISFANRLSFPVSETNPETLSENREVLHIAQVSAKNTNMQFVNTHDFARLVDHNHYNKHKKQISTGNTFATTKPEDKKRQKSLLAAVFNNQIAKLSNRINNKSSRSNKAADPTYVKVIDGGLLVFNTITGSESSTVKTYNSEGELTSYQIEGQEVLLGRNFSRSSQ